MVCRIGIYDVWFLFETKNLTRFTIYFISAISSHPICGMPSLKLWRDVHNQEVFFLKYTLRNIFKISSGYTLLMSPLHFSGSASNGRGTGISSSISHAMTVIVTVHALDLLIYPGPMVEAWKRLVIGTASVCLYLWYWRTPPGLPSVVQWKPQRKASE